MKKDFTKDEIKVLKEFAKNMLFVEKLMKELKISKIGKKEDKWKKKKNLRKKK